MADGTGFPPTMPAVAEVEALRLELVDAGYRPVEIINWNADHPSAGKAPLRGGWQHGGELGPVDRRALNTGILCDGLRAIDVDTDNPTVGAAVRRRAMEILGEAPMRYRDNSPRVLLLYRAAEGSPGKRVVASKAFGKVEVLGKGQQFVAYGIHHTGAALRWMPEGPTAWAADSLPAVSEDHITEFLTEAGAIIGAKAPTDHGADPDRQPSTMGQRGELLEVLAGVHVIPNEGPADWEGWNRVGMAIWAATAGCEAGRDAWHAWSKRHPDYDAAATDARWLHYPAHPPTTIGAGTLFTMARDHGWRRDKPGTADEPKQSRPASSLTIINPASLAGTQPPAREWIVPGWLPVGAVTLCYGDGGTGKTLMAQQLMTSCATGGHWIGLDVLRCRSVALFCEDDEHELHRRQTAICDGYGLRLDDLADMGWASGTGQDNLLVTFDHDGKVQPTKRFDDLMRAARDHAARLIVVDTAADTFGGNENDRQQVRQYVGHILGKLALELGAAVLVNAHPSRTGLTSGDLDGGSTGWSNSARSRWSLARPKGDDVPLDTPDRVLTRRKSNYASIGEEIRLRWQSGVFVAAGDAHKSSGGPLRQAHAEAVFLTLLDRCTASGVHVAFSRNAMNYAPKVFAARPDRGDLTRAELDGAMQRLMADNRIRLEEYGRPGDPRQRLARGTPTPGTEAAA